MANLNKQVDIYGDLKPSHDRKATAGLTTLPQHHKTMRLFKILWGDYTPAERVKAALFTLGLFAAALLASLVESL